MRSTTVRIVVAIGPTLLLAAPVAMASGGLPKIPSYSGPYGKHDFKVRPAVIDYGMGSAFFAGRHRSAPLSWTSWTATSGKGSGWDWLDNCKPNCAAGTFHSYPVNLKVWNPQTVNGHLIFTRMTVTFTGNRPPHQSNHVWRVRHHGNVYFWAFPMP
jgi:hypothetical protein